MPPGLTGPVTRSITGAGPRQPAPPGLGASLTGSPAIPPGGTQLPPPGGRTPVNAPASRPITGPVTPARAVAPGGDALADQLHTILAFGVKSGISDIHLKAGKPPVFRRHGKLGSRAGTPTLGAHHLECFVHHLAQDPRHREQLATKFQSDLSYGIEGVGRFRVNIFKQRGVYSIAIRVLNNRVSSITELSLPGTLETISQEKRGLVLVTGTTGCGKSTTLASMLDYINRSVSCHLLTIEDPVEYLLEDKRAIVSQREVGADVVSFAEGLRGALRQDPDVILIGEMRDLETIDAAMIAAETGHMVFSTLHTLDAPETINRIVAAFPPYHQPQVRRQLASVLKAIISLRLMPRKDGKGRVPACEILVANELVREILSDEHRLGELREVMARSYSSYGMQTFDQSIMQAYAKEMISYEEALKQASNPNDFALRVSGISGGDEVDWDNFVLGADKDEGA